MVKAGDKVIITKPDSSNSRNMIGWVSSMDPWDGRTCTVGEVFDESITLLEDKTAWHFYTKRNHYKAINVNKIHELW